MSLKKLIGQIIKKYKLILFKDYEYLKMIKWPKFYRALKVKNIYTLNEFSLLPIRFEDRYLIMKWRNEQIYHLRQNKPLTKKIQNDYFVKEIFPLFNQTKPNQILFSFLKKKILVGYGGLVHINWQKKNAEISFVMNTSLENQNFEDFWDIFLKLIDKVLFDLNCIEELFTFAFDIRPNIYKVLEKNNFQLVKDDEYNKDGKIIRVKVHRKKL